MKRIVALALALLLALAGAALAEEAQGDWYMETAGALAIGVGALAGDEAYLGAMSGNAFESLEALRQADFASVQGAWKIAISEEALGQMDGWDWNGMTKTGRETLLSRLPVALLTQWNAYAGAEAIAASSLLAYGQTYAMPADFAQCAIVLQLDGAQVGVAFMQTGEDTVTATAYPLFKVGEATLEEMLENLAEDQIPLTWEKLF